MLYTPWGSNVAKLKFPGPPLGLNKAYPLPIRSTELLSNPITERRRSPPIPSIAPGTQSVNQCAAGFRLLVHLSSPSILSYHLRAFSAPSHLHTINKTRIDTHIADVCDRVDLRTFECPPRRRLACHGPLHPNVGPAPVGAM
jgi:hypothetical protein